MRTWTQASNMAPSSWATAILVGLTAWGVSGCATREAGYRISDESIAFIQPGVTTRSEVVENLGTPLLELQEPHVIAYSWGRLRVTAASKPIGQDVNIGTRPMDYAVGPAPSQEGGLVETKRWVCCIALDSNNRVTRFEKLRLESVPSLEEAVRQWAASSTTPQ